MIARLLSLCVVGGCVGWRWALRLLIRLVGSYRLLRQLPNLALDETRQVSQVGLEDIDDVIYDIKQALDGCDDGL